MLPRGSLSPAAAPPRSRVAAAIPPRPPQCRRGLVDAPQPRAHREAPQAMSPHDLFLAACAVTSVTLFALGAAKSSFVQGSALRLGAETLALGALCASVAYSAGVVLSAALGGA